jgi:hypothetical protein
VLLGNLYLRFTKICWQNMCTCYFGIFFCRIAFSLLLIDIRKRNFFLYFFDVLLCLSKEGVKSFFISSRTNYVTDSLSVVFRDQFWACSTFSKKFPKLICKKIEDLKIGFLVMSILELVSNAVKIFTECI